MRHNDDVFTPLQFHDDRFKTYDNVTIGFPTPIPVVVFIVVTGQEVFGIRVGYFLIREAITDTGVELIKGFPFKLGVAGRGGGKEAGSGYRAP